MAETSAQAYEVTATKYRPKTFDELAGQEFVVSTIKNSLQSGQIAHAYLFSGPRGCGKTSAARILARSLNCAAVSNGENGMIQGPCGVCDNCKAISHGASLDVLEIDGASNNSVNDVRQIRDEVLFPPQAGRYKVYIIDEVHMLSSSAFNALLKTIEEPPPYIVFIFATTELHKVPATIKSRCQQFNFRLIPIETIQGILKKICAEKGVEAEEDALFWIARESTGSMRDAFTLFDQVVSFSGGIIRSDLIRQKLGLAGLEKLNALAEACAAGNAPGAFALTDEIIDSGVAIEQFVIDLAGYYRSMLLLKNGVTRESLLGYRPALFSSRVLETYDTIRFEQALEILLNCYRDIRYSVSPRFELEAAVSKLSWLNQWASPAELRDAIENAQNVIYNGAQMSAPSRNTDSRDASLNNARTGVLPANEEASARPAAGSGAGSAAAAFAGAEDKSQGSVLAGSNPPQTVKPGGSSGEGRSLSDDFRRMIAARESGTPEDEDVPFWDSVVQNKKETAETSTLAERVLSVIPGTIVG